MSVVDRDCAVALCDEAGSRFQCELVQGEAGWIVRLQPATGGSTGWIFELLALVERWLEARLLPSATVEYGGRRYVLGASEASR